VKIKALYISWVNRQKEWWKLLQALMVLALRQIKVMNKKTAFIAAPK